MKKNKDIIKRRYFSPVAKLVQIIGRLQRLVFKKNKVIYVTCFPKSGSSYITETLSKITEVNIHRTVYAFFQNEQDIYLPAIIDGYWSNFATQQHTRATTPNISILNSYSIRPIVLVRNIFDIVISFRDHIYNQSKPVPMAHVTEEFFYCSEKCQYEFIIDLVLPWYFNFYVSWYEAEREKKIDFLWVTYEDMLKDRHSFFNQILTFLNINIKKTGQQVENLIYPESKDLQKYKFNKGVSGRGAKLLSEEQKQKIRNYAKYYPIIDFSRIGL